MFKWTVLSVAILAAAIFFNSKNNRTAFLTLAKRFGKAILIAVAIVIALLLHSQIIQ